MRSAVRYRPVIAHAQNHSRVGAPQRHNHVLGPAMAGGVCDRLPRNPSQLLARVRSDVIFEMGVHRNLDLKAIAQLVGDRLERFLRADCSGIRQLSDRAARGCQGPPCGNRDRVLVAQVAQPSLRHGRR